MTNVDHARHHADRLLNQISEASAAGKAKLVRYLAHQYISSYDAKLIASKMAFRKAGRPSVPAEIIAVAEKSCPWKGTNEPVKVFSIPKGSSGDRRIALKFGVENRALQYLVKPVLVATANLHPHQYGAKGVQHAIALVAAMMAKGYVFAREIDIKDCFPSFVEENLHQFLPLSKEVIRHVIISEHLTLIGGNLYDLFGHAEDGVESPFVTDTFELARRGIPQGSAASNAVSEILLSKPYFDLPTGAVVTGFADNSLLMGKTEKEAVSIMKAFGASLKKHPVGQLEPKLKGKFNKGDHVDYLGHRLALVAGKVKIEPHPDHLTEFDRETHRRLVRFKKAANPWQAMNAERAYRSYVNSWAANFCLCNGVEAMRAKALAKVEAAKAMTKLIASAGD
jgi:hypothetical protein